MWQKQKGFIKQKKQKKKTKKPLNLKSKKAAQKELNVEAQTTKRTHIYILLKGIHSYFQFHFDIFPES